MSGSSQKGKPKPRGTDAERFMAKVRVKGQHWLWTGRIGASTGLGQFRLADGSRPSPLHAALNIFGTGCPKGYAAFNGCGVPGCVRHDHAVVSEKSDARKSAVWRRDYVPTHGEANYCAKLTDATVIRLRRGAARGELTSIPSVAFALGVTRASISHAVRGFTFRHVNHIAAPVSRRTSLAARMALRRRSG